MPLVFHILPVSLHLFQEAHVDVCRGMLAMLKLKQESTRFLQGKRHLEPKYLLGDQSRFPDARIADENLSS
jgi:hypothetical protein